MSSDASGRRRRLGLNDRARSAVAARPRGTALAIGIAVLAALGVAALRSDGIHVRYGLADAVRQERELLEERRVAVARLRALRDPARLALLAREQGFVRPARIRTLPVAAPGAVTP